MSINRSPEFVILGILSRGPSHGYEIHQTLQREFQELWTIGQNQTYNILKRLADQGMVAQEQQMASSGKEVAQFRLSAQGRAHFEHWLSQPTAPSMTKMRTEFITRLIFAAEAVNQPLEALVSEQIAVLEERIKHLQANLTDSQDLMANKLGRELRIQSLTVLLAWLQALPLEPFMIIQNAKGKEK